MSIEPGFEQGIISELQQRAEGWALRLGEEIATLRSKCEESFESFGTTVIAQLESGVQEAAERQRELLLGIGEQLALESGLEKEKEAARASREARWREKWRVALREIRCASSQREILGRLLDAAALLSDKVWLLVARKGTVIGWDARGLDEYRLGRFQQFASSCGDGDIFQSAAKGTMAVSSSQAEEGMPLFSEDCLGAVDRILIAPLLVFNSASAYLCLDGGSLNESEAHISDEIETVLAMASLWLENMTLRKSLGLSPLPTPAAQPAQVAAEAPLAAAEIEEAEAEVPAVEEAAVEAAEAVAEEETGFAELPGEAAVPEPEAVFAPEPSFPAEERKPEPELDMELPAEPEETEAEEAAPVELKPEPVMDFELPTAVEEPPPVEMKPEPVVDFEIPVETEEAIPVELRPEPVTDFELPAETAEPFPVELKPEPVMDFEFPAAEEAPPSLEMRPEPVLDMELPSEQVVEGSATVEMMREPMEALEFPLGEAEAVAPPPRFEEYEEEEETRKHLPPADMGSFSIQDVEAAAAPMFPVETSEPAPVPPVLDEFLVEPEEIVVPEPAPSAPAFVPEPSPIILEPAAPVSQPQLEADEFFLEEKPLDEILLEDKAAEEKIQNTVFGQTPFAAPPPPAPAPAPEPPKPPAAAPPLWSNPEEERLHVDAKRFARLLVSEIKLYNEEAVAEGRIDSNLYSRLRRDVDRSREMYDKRVSPTVAIKIDYFHEELVRILGEGEASRMGAEYPGPQIVA